MFNDFRIEILLHAGRLNCYSNIRTFYAKLLQIWSYKFHHAAENEILNISPGGTTFQTTSPLRTEADFFSKILGLTRVWSGSGPHFLWWKNMWTRPGSDPKFWKKIRIPLSTFNTLAFLYNYRAPGGWYGIPISHRIHKFSKNWFDLFNVQKHFFIRFVHWKGGSDPDQTRVRPGSDPKI